MASLTHDIFIKGCQYNFEINGPNDVEVSKLYPEISYTSVEDFFDEYLPLPLELEEQEKEGSLLSNLKMIGRKSRITSVKLEDDGRKGRITSFTLEDEDEGSKGRITSFKLKMKEEQDQK